MKFCCSVKPTKAFGNCCEWTSTDTQVKKVQRLKYPCQKWCHLSSAHKKRKHSSPCIQCRSPVTAKKNWTDATLSLLQCVAVLYCRQYVFSRRFRIVADSFILAAFGVIKVTIRSLGLTSLSFSERLINLDW